LITPIIYGVPNIHKFGIPLRPIVNTIGSPTYLLAQYLAKKTSTLIWKHLLIHKKFHIIYIMDKKIEDE